MAQRGARPARQHGGEPAPFPAQSTVPDRENPAMNAVQPSCLNSACEALPANTQILKLLTRDHPVLAGGNPGDLGVPGGVGIFLTHVRE
jgi:hypothetical protein